MYMTDFSQKPEDMSAPISSNEYLIFDHAQYKPIAMIFYEK
jgi:hypothetical protein